MSDKRRLISVHLGRSDSYPSVRLCLFPRGMSPCDVFTGFLPVASRVFPFGLRLSSYSDFQNFFGSTDLLSQASVCSIWIRAYPGPIPRVQSASAPVGGVMLTVTPRLRVRPLSVLRRSWRVESSVRSVRISMTVLYLPLLAGRVCWLSV